MTHDCLGDRRELDGPLLRDAHADLTTDLGSVLDVEDGLSEIVETNPLTGGGRDG